MNIKKNFKKISSLILALALIVGIAAPNLSIAEKDKNSAVENLTISVVNKYNITKENNKKGKEVEKINIEDEKNIYNWKLEEGKLKDNGKTVDFVMETPIYLEGKTPKGVYSKALLTRYLDMDELIDDVLEKENIEKDELDLDNTRVLMVANDGFQVAYLYKEIVNLDMDNPNRTNIEDFSANNATGGEAFNGKLVLRYIKSETTGGKTVDFEPKEGKSSDCPRYYGGIKQGVAVDDIANFGNESLQGVTSIKIIPVLKK